jgi:hypothetical protein
MKAFKKMLNEMGFKDEQIFDKINTFAGLKFKENEGDGSLWLDK